MISITISFKMKKKKRKSLRIRNCLNYYKVCSKPALVVSWPYPYPYPPMQEKITVKNNENLEKQEVNTVFKMRNT